MSNSARVRQLPTWPQRSIAILSTIDPAPHAIPISAPVRSGGLGILFCLRRDRDSVVRIRRHPEVALTILAEGDIAFTARGHARALDAALPSQPDYLAIELAVDQIDDHRQSAFTVDAGIGRSWLDHTERDALGARVQALIELACLPRPQTAPSTLPPEAGDHRRGPTTDSLTRRSHHRRGETP